MPIRQVAGSVEEPSRGTRKVADGRQLIKKRVHCEGQERKSLMMEPKKQVFGGAASGSSVWGELRVGGTKKERDAGRGLVGASCVVPS